MTRDIQKIKNKKAKCSHCDDVIEAQGHGQFVLCKCSQSYIKRFGSELNDVKVGGCAVIIEEDK